MAQPPEPHRIVRRQLGPLGLRLRLSDTLLFASRSFWVATLLFALVLIVGRLTPIPHLRLWALLPLLLWVLAVPAHLLLRPLPLPRIARRVDAALNLRERLATALELQRADATDELSTLQQQDAARVARSLKWNQLPLRFDRRTLLMGMLPLALGLALLVLPNPQDAILAERAEVRTAVEEAAEQLDQLEERIRQNEELTPEERERLEEQLAALEEQLRQNQGNREEALADLSAAEARLQQQLDPQTDARRAALEQMARSMEQMSGRQPGQQPDIDAAAEQLEQLARELEQMTEQERQELAEQLGNQAAQMAGGDPQTAQQMADAAQALNEGDLEQAARSLQQAAANARAAQGEIADQEALEESLSQIQEGREQIAQAGRQQGEGQPGEGQQGEGQPGEGQQGEGQQGEGQQGQQGEGQQGQGQQGQQGQQGEGQQGQPGDGQGGDGTNQTNAGQGQSSSGSEVDPNQADSGSSAGDEEGETIYQPYDPSRQQGDPDFIPGEQSEDGQSQMRQGDANLPGVNNPSLVPYEEVLPEYAESASEALDRGYIPPHLKDYVRDYFSQLEPGQQ